MFLLFIQLLESPNTFRPRSKCEKGSLSYQAFSGTLVEDVYYTFDCVDFSSLPFLAMFQYNMPGRQRDHKWHSCTDGHVLPDKNARKEKV